MKRTMRWVGLGAVAFAMACGVRATVDDAPRTAAATLDFAIPGTLSASTVPVDGQVYAWHGDPRVVACSIKIAGRDPVSVPPHLIVRKPDSRGIHYGFSDGFSLPFPTPWVSDAPADAGAGVDAGKFAGAQCGPTKDQTTQPCFFLPKVHEYEHKLAPHIPVRFQFKVKHLERTVGDGGLGGTRGTEYFKVVGHDWFFTGTENQAQAGAIQQLTQEYAGVGFVDPHWHFCVYVLDAQSDGRLTYTNRYAVVGTSHDPVNWPD